MTTNTPLTVEKSTNTVLRFRSSNGSYHNRSADHVVPSVPGIPESLVEEREKCDSTANPKGNLESIIETDY